MGRLDNIPKIKYPYNFKPPGPATQADSTLACFENFLDDHEEDYNDGPMQGLEPEEWVELRSLYVNIHWMYRQLIGEEVVLEVDSEKKEAP